MSRDRASSSCDRRFHCSEGNQDLVVLVTVVKFLLGELFCRKPMQKCDCRIHISIRLDNYIFRWKEFFKEQSRGQGRKPPIIAPTLHVVTTDLANTAGGGKQNSA